MDLERRFWNEIADPYRACDWNECVRRIRVRLDAEPFAMTPRQIMARLLVLTGYPRHGLLQYEKLLPLAVRAGDLYRALVIQKHMDRLQPGTPGRYATLQKWFRLVGVSQAPPASEVEGCITASALLALPKDVFEWMGGEVSVDALDPGPREEEAPGSTCWVVVFGSLLWKARLPSGRERGEVRSERGEFAYLSGTPGTLGSMRFTAETACECLRFDGALLKEIRLRVPSVGGAIQAGGSAAGLPALPVGLRKSDAAGPAVSPRKPAVSGTPNAPPRLPSPGPTSKADKARDDGDWVESGQVTLGETSGEELPQFAAWGAEILDLDSAEAAAAAARGDRAARRARTVNTKRPKQERRTRNRTPVDLRGSVGLLGLGGPEKTPLRCRLFDLSPFGAGIEFDDHSMRHRVASLAQSAVVLDLAPQIGSKPLRLAGRVRWIDQNAPEGIARLGIEFVLVTEDHLAAIGGLMTALA